jgi:hypothetical protein
MAPLPPTPAWMQPRIPGLRASEPPDVRVKPLAIFSPGTTSHKASPVPLLAVLCGPTCTGTRLGHCETARPCHVGRSAHKTRVNRTVGDKQTHAEPKLESLKSQAHSVKLWASLSTQPLNAMQMISQRRDACTLPPWHESIGMYKLKKTLANRLVGDVVAKFGLQRPSAAKAGCCLRHTL